MKQNINIDINHLTRIEGHGNIVVNIKDGNIEKCEWQVPETPRFFESMVRGRHYSEVARITSRICGICSVGHTLASVKATEAALGMKISKQSRKIRRILKHAENFDSHIVHIFFLAAPDLFGAESVFPLLNTNPDIVKAALRFKRFGHVWGSLITCRTTHPLTIIPGGFSKLPSKDNLYLLKKRITELLPDIDKTFNKKNLLEITSKIPNFNRPTEYISFSAGDVYGLYDGYIQSILFDGTKEKYMVSKYKKITNEYVSPTSTAKFTKNKLDSYMVGALARFNNNYDVLHPKAKLLADLLGLKSICTNPYMNTVAQAIECVHSLHDGLQLLNELLDEYNENEEIVRPTKYSRGISAVEVPRGILFHEYEYDDEGICQNANCVIPTNQNHANIQLDFNKLVPELLAANKSKQEMELALSMLVRAYDPCVSCSTHCVKINFV